MHSSKIAQETAAAVPTQTQTAASSLPAPTNEPWCLSTMPWSIATQDLPPDAVMQFKALPHLDTQHRMLRHQKRKTNFPDIVPTKQFISEEKITAHFNGLHISSDYIPNENASASSSTDINSSTATISNTSSSSGRDFSNLTFADYQITAKQLEEKLKNASHITINDEVKKYHEEQKKIALLVNKALQIEEPCKAVVLWQPQAPIIEILKQQKEVKEQKEDEAQRQKEQMEMLEDCLDAPLPEVNDEEFDEISYDNNNTCSVDFNNGMDIDF